MNKYLPGKFIGMLWLGAIIFHSLVTAQQIIFKNPLRNFGSVSDITQDPKGIMWFTSLNELHRYDGYSISTYKHDPLNPKSLQATRLECVHADKDGIIWLGSFGSGLERLDPSTGIFTHFRHDPKNPNSISSDIVTVIFEDRENNFWIGTHGGLNLMDRKTGSFTHFSHNNADSTTISDDQVRAIYQDREGTLWIGTGSAWVNSGTLPGEAGINNEGGLNRMNIHTGTFIRYMNNPADPHSLINNKVRAIFEDSRGTFWVGTAGDGLHTMDRKTGLFQRYTYNPLHPENLSRSPVNTKIPHDHITFITEDVTGAIWIGTLAGGISRYDPETQKIKHYTSQDTSCGITDVGVFGHYISRDGVLWITSLSGNIFTLPPSPLVLPHVNEAGGATSFYLDKDSILWIGTPASGLLRKNLRDGSIKSFAVKGAISNIIHDPEDNLWIATLGNRLYRFNLKTENLTTYAHDRIMENSLVNDTVYALYMDRAQHLWIGTHNGMDQFDSKTDIFTHYHHHSNDSTTLSSNVIFSIRQDQKGNLWIGFSTASGIDQMDMQHHTFKQYLNGDYVYSIAISRDSTIWAGGQIGLYKYDPKSDNFIQITDEVSGKDISIVSSIAEDDQHNLWLCTSTGILRLNEINQELFTFGKNTQVDPNTVWSNAMYIGPNQQLYIGNSTGYYAFNPTSIFHFAKPPEILLGDMSVNDELSSQHKKELVDLWKLHDISLGHNHNSFSIEFIPVDYSNDDENHAYYKLENYDQEWRTTTNPDKAYYYKVVPGKYIFRVKAFNAYGIWSEKSIEITITPPWYTAWWAYTLLIVAIILLLWLFISFRARHLIIEKKGLEEKISIRTGEVLRQNVEIAAQRDNLKKLFDDLKAAQARLIQTEKMASLGQLTSGIAHEIQNPLNFVNNFSEVSIELAAELATELNSISLDSWEKAQLQKRIEELAHNQEKINHHGKRADAIVKSMLQHSRKSTGEKVLTDINALADEYLRLSYHGLRAKDKSFNAAIETAFDDSIGKIRIVSEEIGRVILNLITNAFYSVSEKQKNLSKTSAPGTVEFHPTVKVTTRKLGDEVEISVSDNGAGIPDTILDKLFQPFFTTKPAGAGTGLGLSLSYDIIKAHHGEITVTSNENEGAVFKILLPIIT